MARIGTLLRCGHRDREVSAGRCFPCHLHHLRATGRGARADRMERLRQLQDEGRLNWARLLTSLVAGYEDRP